MRVDQFDYFLPPDQIAQHPLPVRDESRLLVLHRASGCFEHCHFRRLARFLKPGDLLVMNNSKVIPARLRAFKPRSGGRLEVLLAEELGPNDWWVLLRPGKRVREGSRMRFLDLNGREVPVQAQVVGKNPEGQYRLLFDAVPNLIDWLEQIGEVPLPPYIGRPAEPDDQRRYQTVYAGPAGSVAAPTAGLHFTGDFLAELRDGGVEICEVTLHVGWATFAPVKVDQVESHRMHRERYEVTSEALTAMARARDEGRRIVAVGTTTVRVLESLGTLQTDGKPVTGQTDLFIRPPFDFKIVEGLVTNFHLPRSSLLMLVSAFASPGQLIGRERVLAAYKEAVKTGYRFFSYGDAMLLI